jgi:FAD binding domain/Berberine and berberine like
VAAGAANATPGLADLLGGVPWHRLAGSLTGRLVLPGDASYALDSQLYNERFDAVRPAAIAFCASPADVQRSVDFARRHSVQVAARSGGHSYGGYSSCPGLVIDVTPMARVRVAADKATASVGAGARLIDVYDALGDAGRLLPGGSCPTVGIAGLTLGGGISVFSRRYGLTCDQLADLRIVTADGRFLTCDPGRHDDLFWACRGGGGGNFGIVTAFTFHVHPIPTISLFTLEWPWDAAADALAAWVTWIGDAPDELWANCQLLSAGSAGGAFVRVTGVFCGATGRLTSLLRPLRAAVPAAPTTDFVGTEDYLPAMLIEAGCEGKSVAACHLPSENPAGTLSRAAFGAKSAYVDAALPDSGIAAAVGAVALLDDDVPEVGGGIVFDAYGGAVNRVRPGATAFVHRDALACAQWSFFWATGASTSIVDAGTSWLASTGESLRPYVRGAYQNYIDPTLADWESEYYGTNLARLVEIKRKVDPDDFFHFAQSVPTRLR